MALPTLEEQAERLAAEIARIGGARSMQHNGRSESFQDYDALTARYDKLVAQIAAKNAADSATGRGRIRGVRFLGVRCGARKTSI